MASVFQSGTHAMKEGFDKEMDSLLRRRTRGVVESRAGGDGLRATQHGAHLDADELGAFAEGALPAPARLAAASHLADCDECRQVVVGIARVTGGAAESKKHAVAVPASKESVRPAAWRAWLGSLFAPRVLRFAAPVLALSLVGVVSFIALRSKNNEGMRNARDARRPTEVVQEQSSAGGAATMATANANANANAEGLADANSNASRSNINASSGATPQPPGGRGHGAVEEPSVADATREDSAPPPPPPAASPEGPGESMAKAAPRPATVDGSDNTKAENRGKAEENKDKSARGAEQNDELAANEQAVQRGRAAQTRAGEVQMPDGGARNQKRAADNNVSNVYGGSSGAASNAAAAPKESERDRASSRAETARRSRSATAEGRKADDEDNRAAETRSAAGHRFRREGSAWVDVNYKSSMPSTGVRRGTEAFRALVADVPDVGRVAEQIGGEVVVVVGGRAYRIR